MLSTESGSLIFVANKSGNLVVWVVSENQLKSGTANISGGSGSVQVSITSSAQVQVTTNAKILGAAIMIIIKLNRS